MLFTQQVFLLQCFFIPSNPFWYLILIISNPAWCCLQKSCSWKTCNVVLQSSKHEEMTFPCEFIFLSIPNFVGAIVFKKNLIEHFFVGRQWQFSARWRNFVQQKNFCQFSEQEFQSKTFLSDKFCASWQKLSLTLATEILPDNDRIRYNNEN